MSTRRNSLPTALGLLEILLTLIEGIAIIGPILRFFPQTAQHPELLTGLGLSLIIWGVTFFRSAQPLWETSRHHPRNALYHLARFLPARGLWLRLILWSLWGLASALYLAHLDVLTTFHVFTVFTICLLHTLIIALIRWAIQQRLMQNAITELRLEPSWIQLQADILADQLVGVAVVVGAVTGSFLSLFVYLFVPITTAQYLRMETWFPWIGTVLFTLWYFVVRPRQMTPVLHYLRQSSQGLTPTRHELWAACRTAHRLPLGLALTKFFFFALAGAILFFQAEPLYQFTRPQALLVFLAIIIVSLGTGIYEMIWSRAVLRPVVAHLMAQPEAGKLHITALSLRLKMLLSFGGVVIFTVLLALFWTYLQYGNLRQGFTQSQARRDLELALAMARASSVPVAQTMAQLPRRKDALLLYIPQRGSVDGLLDRNIVAHIRHHAAGSLRLPAQGWRGIFARLDAQQPHKGSLAVLMRDAANHPFSLDMMGLVFFFIIVLAIALGVVLMTSADLTRPLAALSQRAAEMSQGNLEQPMLPGGEFDEIGRLTLSFESMRQALQQKIQTIEQLNIGLEGKVQQRTAALEQANRELLATLTELQKTQQQLVTSEKLASIGQLVAGIAHEINNPINAVINTIEPLNEAAHALLEADPHDPTLLAEAQEDMEAMLRVIRSGAQRTQRIVLALRNYTRQDSEALSSFHLHQDIEETLALLQHKLREVTVEQELTAQPMLLAYRGQLNQALMNLIANAADALEGQPEPRILIRTQDRAGQLQIIVQDNGPGIPEDLVPRIFDPFFTTKEVNKGTGLGLSISQRIVERHGGTISVRSDKQGTMIILELPRKLEAGQDTP